MENRRISLLLFLVLMHVLLNRLEAQMMDDFSSGFFSQHGWTGDTLHFRHTSSSAIPQAQHPAIQLNASGSGASLIYSLQPSSPMMEWRGWFKLSFNPSASNFARFYLTVSSGFPGSVDQCIFVGIGMNADRVGLYRHNGSQLITLVEDTSMLYNQSTNQVRIRVRMRNHWWLLEADPTGGEALQFIDSVYYPVSSILPVAGISCQYTSSNATKFYVDDIYCGPIPSDTLPPAFIELRMRNPSQLTVLFSEALSDAVLSNPSSFVVSEPVGKPLLCVADHLNPQLIHLYYPVPFSDGNTLKLMLKDVRDNSGNMMPDTMINFVWHSVARNGVLIHEIMADPSPAIKLPESEYIELRNNSPYPVSLCDWELWIDNTLIPLPCFNLASDSCLVLVNEKDTMLWSGYPHVTGVPKLTLRNEAACIVLKNYNRALIHSVCYQSGWHSTSLQSEGGYSLELKDPANPCDQIGTWGSSLDMRGGTPGFRNSFTTPFPDVRAPFPLKASVPDPFTLHVYMSEPIDTTRSILQLFEIDGRENPFLSVIPKYPLYDQLTYYLDEPMLPDTVYKLIQTDTLKDCSGNYTLTSVLPFGIPAAPDSLDLLFNEIMFQPSDDGVEYIEILNNSKKIIDLSTCLLARIDTLYHYITDLYTISNEPTLIFPGKLLVVTTDIARLLSKHLQASRSDLLEGKGLPSLPDQGATYALITDYGVIVDQMTYHPDYHAPSVSDARGIALERLSPDISTSRPDNWYSASQGSGWGTPTQPNSQSAFIPVSEAKVQVSPLWFSPYSGGNQLLSYIHIRDLQPGTLVNITITDELGIPVRHLIREAIAGASEMYPWDGSDDLGVLCRGGVYLICTTLYHQAEGYQKMKLPVVILAR
jgi:hypothetical protein